MNGFLPLAFGAPATLLALFALPAIWWLLRLTPPKPRSLDFPPTAMLRDLVAPEETPAHTPWWLLALRFGLAALLILAFAAPVWRPLADDDGRDGPLWLIVDDGWAAASGWDETAAALAARIDRAGARGRPVVLAATADGADQAFEPGSAEEAKRRLATLAPRPRAEARNDLVAGLTRSAERVAPGSIVWFTHGLDVAPSPDGRSFAEALVRLGGEAPLVIAPPATIGVTAIDTVDNGMEAMTARLTRVASEAADRGVLRALDPKGRPLGEASFAFEAGKTVAEARFDLPTAVRNDVARVEIGGSADAGAVRLLDDRWRRRIVGLVSGAGAGTDRTQPLLGPGHYLDAALAPFADLRRAKASETTAAIGELIDARVSVLVTADVGTLGGEAGARLQAWVEGGGVLVRFAGPRLLGGSDDDPLLPVAIRRGERTLGGALTWGNPRGLGPYPADGPFAGMVPAGDVRVSRQVLAEPGPDVAERTWAVLEDGTPLVTAAKRGAGRVVLFHVGAETSWSNLPLSGTFVEMLRRITALSAATRAEARGVGRGAALPPWRLLDGFGRLGPPPPEARPIAGANLPERASRDHPPGLWGSDDGFVALATRKAGDPLAAIDLHRLERASVTARVPVERRDLRPLLLTLALILALIDTALVLAPALRGRRALAALMLALGLAALPVGESRAAESAADRFAAEATREMRLAHVLTGDAALDDIARRGLVGLGRVLGERTAVDLGEPIGVDPGRDELAFFPLVYWPIAVEAQPVSPTALGRIDAFMKSGGMVIFDTRDAAEGFVRASTGRPSAAGAALRRILGGLDLPELEPVPSDHVLGRTFYILRDFPGRFEGRMWVEASPPADPERPSDRPARAGDGVSPLIVTGNDLAGAWAVDEAGGDLLPMASSDPRGREMALRVGVNIVMYALTGNYKADQVHVPALLERLGR